MRFSLVCWPQRAACGGWASFWGLDGPDACGPAWPTPSPAGSGSDGWPVAFGLDLGYPWIPWALACALLAVRWRRRLYAAGAAAALALILLGGDFGLTCATLAVLALFLLVAVTSLRRERPYIALRRDEALIAVLIGLLGFGLAAVQLLPQIGAAFAGAEVVRPAGSGAGLGRLLGALIARPRRDDRRRGVRLPGRRAVPFSGRSADGDAACEPSDAARSGAVGRAIAALGRK